MGSSWDEFLVIVVVPSDLGIDAHSRLSQSEWVQTHDDEENQCGYASDLLNWKVLTSIVLIIMMSKLWNVKCSSCPMFLTGLLTDSMLRCIEEEKRRRVGWGWSSAPWAPLPLIMVMSNTIKTLHSNITELLYPTTIETLHINITELLYHSLSEQQYHYLLPLPMSPCERVL